MPRKPASKSPKQLNAENKDLRTRLEEAEDTLRALRSGNWDALIISDEVDNSEEIIALRHSELRYRRLFEAAQGGILILSAETGMIEAVNPSLIKMLGYSREEFVKKKLWEVGAFKDIKASTSAFEALQDREYIRYENLPLRAKNGKLIRVEFVSNVYLVDNEKVIQCDIRDITERKKAEESLLENERLLSEAQHIAHMGSWSYDIVTDTLRCSNELYRLWDTSPQEFQHNLNGFLSLIYAADRPLVESWMEQIKAGREVTALDFRLFRKNGELRYFQNRGKVIFDSAGKPDRFTGTTQDISDHKLAEIQIHQQIRHLTALSKIDQAIISNVNLEKMMETFLAEVVVQLQVDAADILVLRPDAKMLDYVAGRGFRTQAAQTAQEMPLDRSLAGHAVKERRLIQIENLQELPRDLQLSERLAGEGFVSYVALPLISLGNIKGVLEVFYRTSSHPYAEWAGFMHTLAGQAAIAIENASLFANLENSNRELSRAYDATIEGWSRALDLRDKETEGHTLRATELTLTLTRKFSFTAREKLHIRWGALLHDIGKLGIPDSILHKPDTLSKDEWAILRKHPQYAYDLLQPIAFLAPALDIPYCHHEKWDGTGYPRGLKGDEIPQAARIFAAVDVWDALTSDRPYRPAWSQEQSLAHIQEQSGKHFDPQVVDIFIPMLKKESNKP